MQPLKERRYQNTNIPASQIKKVRDYLNQTNSASLGKAWGHNIWSYELRYADGPVSCANFDEAAKVVKQRGETTQHLTYFESETGRKLRLDTTKPGEIALGVDNGRLTDAMLKRVEEIMSLSQHPRRVFITHGQGLDWRVVADFIEKECNPKLPFLELASRTNMGRTIIEKLDEEAAHCSFAVVVITGDRTASCASVRCQRSPVAPQRGLRDGASLPAAGTDHEGY